MCVLVSNIIVQHAVSALTSIQQLLLRDAGIGDDKWG